MFICHMSCGCLLFVSSGGTISSLIGYSRHLPLLHVGHLLSGLIWMYYLIFTTPPFVRTRMAPRFPLLPFAVIGQGCTRYPSPPMSPIFITRIVTWLSTEPSHESLFLVSFRLFTVAPRPCR